ncbi:MAG: hypothetical protein ASUL_09549 [Candidatus Aramenus sulfurataquae]|uniref:Uncharacterized protein n=1 Tax=Candidatus Aramenus sulfurataquae TaxID=1326980 RepID=W7KJM7_9CREN|nr:MAG: hypothetical protein ASUL_09549 [Candidatus Aramenus sulfurataquae]
MKIAIDGLDGEGKTTFSQSLDRKYVHFPLFAKQYTVDEYLDEMIENVDNYDLFDRFVFSTIMYQANFTEEQKEKIRFLATKIDLLFITRFSYGFLKLCVEEDDLRVRLPPVVFIKQRGLNVEETLMHMHDKRRAMFLWYLRNKRGGSQAG